MSDVWAWPEGEGFSQFTGLLIDCWQTLPEEGLIVGRQFPGIPIAINVGPAIWVLVQVNSLEFGVASD